MVVVGEKEHFTPLLLSVMFIFSASVEKSLGKLNYVIVFFLTIIGSAILVLLVNGTHPSVGSSGFGYGVWGVYLSVIVFKKTLMDKQSRIALIVFIIVGMVITYLAKASMSGHLGGLISGFIIGTFYI